MKKKVSEERQRKEWFDAVKRNDIKTIQKMLEEGFDVNVQSSLGWTILHEVCFRGGYYKIAKLLIENGADVNIHNKYRDTPLHLACYYGDIDIAKLLIDKGADVNAEDKYGETPLTYFKEKHLQNYKELMQWLSEHHPEKILEYMASESVQSKGVGL